MVPRAGVAPALPASGSKRQSHAAGGMPNGLGTIVTSDTIHWNCAVAPPTDESAEATLMDAFSLESVRCVSSCVADSDHRWMTTLLAGTPATAATASEKLDRFTGGGHGMAAMNRRSAVPPKAARLTPSSH